MRKLSEYENHVIECHQMAAKMRDPVHKKQLEQMADTCGPCSLTNAENTFLSRRTKRLTRMAERG
jgi:hypothetical protein